MITQKELAARLGISRTTIARAINNSPNIKLETKEKIQAMKKTMLVVYLQVKKRQFTALQWNRETVTIQNK